MKFMRLLPVFMLMFLSMLLSCDDDTDTTEADVTYYIQFEADGEPVRFETDTLEYDALGSRVSCVVPGLSGGDGNMAGIQMYTDNIITAAVIRSWEGETFDFDNIDTGTFPAPVFYYINDVIIRSSDIGTSSGSITFTKVKPAGKLYGKKLYTLTGTFHGKIMAITGDQELTITNGTFVIGFSEG